MKEIDLINTFSSLVNGEHEKVTDKKYPSTYIVGCPRSGTTALLQLLSQSGAFAYPTNCLTRFSASMSYASVIQELLFNEEFGFIRTTDTIDFNSEYGRSSGPLNANEFFHFYRRFFPNTDIKHLNKTELTQVDCEGLEAELKILSQFYDKPFISKGLMMQYNLEYFYRKLDKPIFLHIKRNELFVMQSIYKARVKEKKSANNWWSAKPKQFETLKDMDKFSQIAGQVFFTNNTIENALLNIPDKSKLIVSYEDLVRDPVEVLIKLKEKYLQNGFELHFEDMQKISKKLKNGNVITLDEQILTQLKLAYEKLAKNK